MGYFVKKIENNTWNQYKYHYLDHMTAVIDIRDNYWSFAIDLYSINNFDLPINSLAGDLQIPYQQIKDIAFNLASDQRSAKESVEHNNDYSHIYSGSFDVDISQNEYLKQDLNNVQLDLSLSLFIDPEAAKAAGSAISQDDLDDLMNETFEQRWSFEMYYTNTHLIQQTAVVENATSYVLNHENECIPTFHDVCADAHRLVNLTHPINKIVTISAFDKFQILTCKVKFYYWIELETECKTLEKVIDVDHDPTTKVDIKLNDYTIFDYEKNEVIFNPLGMEGFNIPKYSNGYYEVELQLLQSNTINKFVIKNNFNFSQNSVKPYISVLHKLIDNLDDFKEVIFND